MSDENKLTAELTDMGGAVLILKGEKIVGKLTGFMNRTHAVDFMTRINASNLPTPTISGNVTVEVETEFDEYASWYWAVFRAEEKPICSMDSADIDTLLELSQAIVKQVKGENQESV